MAGNNVVWQPQVVEQMLQYYKEKIQAEGRHMIFPESHHEQCAQQINAKYHTNFTQRQVYHKFHKLKAQWKVFLHAKNLSGANFDDVEKKILYDETRSFGWLMQRTQEQNLLLSPSVGMTKWNSYFKTSMQLGSSLFFKHRMTIQALRMKI